MLDDNMDGFVNLAELKAMFVKANADTRGAITVPTDAVLKQMIAEAAADGMQMTGDDFTAVMEAIST